jgi:predicted TIM-barrel fold metal-dependent hydrolase
MKLIDTSVFCGYWPFRNLSPRDPEGLRRHLSSRGVDSAWVAATEAILYPDPMEANEPLFNAVAGDEFFVPLAIINVTLPQFMDDAKACLERWKCRGFKLLPNYHQYSLSDSRVSELVKLSADANVPLCVQMRIMDERAHHQLMLTPGVPADDIAALAQKFPNQRFLACGPYNNELKALKSANLWVEFSSVESGDALGSALKHITPDRLVFGSHSPFYYFEAEAAKLNVGNDLPAEKLEMICARNALTLLG